MNYPRATRKSAGGARYSVMAIGVLAVGALAACYCPQQRGWSTPAAPKREHSCIIVPGTGVSKAARLRSSAFKRGYSRRASMIHGDLELRTRVFEYLGVSGFSTFKQKLSSCRIVLTTLDTIQSRELADLVEVPVLSASPGGIEPSANIFPLAPPLEVLARAAGRFAAGQNARHVAVLSSADARAHAAAQEVGSQLAGASSQLRMDSDGGIPAVPEEAEVVVLVDPRGSAVRAALEQIGSSRPLVVVADDDVELDTESQAMRVVAFSAMDPDLDPRLFRRNPQLNAALGFDAALFAAEILREERSVSGDLVLLHEMVTVGSHHLKPEVGFLVAGRRAFPVIQERSGQQVFLGRF